MSDDTQTLSLQLSLGADALPDEVNDATNQLMRDLLRSNADSVEKVQSDELQAGAKGDPLTIGAIALALGAAAAPEIVKILHSWLARRQSNSVSLKVKLGADEIEFTTAATATPDELEALTDRFAALLKKHASDSEG
jgi:molybdenum cofactor biosynthesis enzyme